MHRVPSVDGSRRKAVYVICVPHPLGGVGSTNSTTLPVLCYLPGLPHVYWLIYLHTNLPRVPGEVGQGPLIPGNSVCSPSSTRNIYLSLKSTETLILIFYLITFYVGVWNKNNQHASLLVVLVYFYSITLAPSQRTSAASIVYNLSLAIIDKNR